MKSDGGVNNIGFSIEYEVISPDPCDSVQCQNGATCEDGMCLCATGFDGELCEMNIDDCADVDCNNGTCVDGIASYICECASGFTGDLCEINIDDCFTDACLNGGECVDDVNFFWCFCPDNFGGDFCEVLLDPETGFPDGCAFEDCARRGACSNLQQEPWFFCECELGVRGERYFLEFLQRFDEKKIEV